MVSRECDEAMIGSRRLETKGPGHIASSSSFMIFFSFFDEGLRHDWDM